MAVSKKLIIGNPNAIKSNELFAIVKVYGPNEAAVDVLITKIKDSVAPDGFTTETKGSHPDTNRKWDIVKV